MSFAPLASVTLWGFPASIVARSVRSSLNRGEFNRLHPDDRRKLVRLLEDLGAAEAAWLEYREQQNGNSETRSAEIESPSGAMTTDEASCELGVSTRRVRQLAASGLGVKHKGQWQMDRVAVLREAERRSAAS